MFLVILLGVFLFIGILIGQFIEEANLKLCYWMLLFLLFVTICNIYISITYYIKLREDPGVKGTRGDSGPQGPKGSGGVCSLSTNCNINDCKSFVTNILANMEDKPGPDYIKLKRKKDNSESLSDNEKKQLNTINNWIASMTQTCERQEFNKIELEKHLKDSLKSENFD